MFLVQPDEHAAHWPRMMIRVHLAVLWEEMYPNRTPLFPTAGTSEDGPLSDPLSDYQEDLFSDFSSEDLSPLSQDDFNGILGDRGQSSGWVNTMWCGAASFSATALGLESDDEYGSECGSEYQEY